MITENSCKTCGHCILDLYFDKMDVKRNCKIIGDSVDGNGLCSFYCKKDINVSVDAICNAAISNTYFNTEQ